MNAEQQSIYNEVTKATRDGSPIWRFITGTAGSGKSHLIKKFQQYALDTGLSLMTCAPTNNMAKTLGGKTIHRAFGITVGNPPKLISRFTFTKPKIVIIDEISMVNRYLFSLICQRLGVSSDPQSTTKPDFILLVFGDLMQLSPLAFRDDVFRHCAWVHFEMRELRLNMRAENDPTFRELSARIRVGTPSVNDMTLLKSRCILPEVKEFTEQTACELAKLVYNMEIKPTILAFLVKDVALMNRAMISLLPNQIEIGSYATEYDPTGPLRAAKLIKEESIKVVLGSPVIMTDNDELLGFTRGERGVITKTISDEFYTVAEIRVRIVQREVSIKRRETRNTKNILCGRAYFPIELGYACTIHKAQGQTLERVLVMSHGKTSPGAFYVAISRVRRLNDLFLTWLPTRLEDFMKTDSGCLAMERQMREAV